MAEPTRPRVAGVRRLIPYVRRHAWLAVSALIALIVMDLLQVVQPYLVKIAIDTNVAARDLAGLGRTALLLGIALAGGFAVQVLFGIGSGPSFPMTSSIAHRWARHSRISPMTWRPCASSSPRGW